MGPVLSGQGTGRTEAVDRVLTVPNVLSLLRLLLVPLFGWLIVTRRDGAAVAVLAGSGFTDWLDGTIARRWGQVSRLGQLLDPLVDRLYILATLLGLTYRGVLPVWLLAVLVLRDVCIALTLPVLRRYGYAPLPVHYVGKAATFNLLCAFPLLLLGDGAGTAAELTGAVGWAFAWWGTVLYWYAGLLYLGQTVSLVRAARAEGDGPGAGADASGGNG